MANNSLNSQELEQLRQYIRKQGFTDDVVVEEILSQFVRKVEGVISDNPRLELDAATELAHRSFGVAGFRPI